MSETELRERLIAEVHRLRCLIERWAVKVSGARAMIATNERLQCELLLNELAASMHKEVKG